MKLCDFPKRAQLAILTVRSKLTSVHRLQNKEGQKQLSLQSWSALCCDGKLVCVCVAIVVCVCAHLAVNQRETLALAHFFFTVAMWLDDTQTMCFCCSYRAARSGLAVPDTEEVQGRRPAP